MSATPRGPEWWAAAMIERALGVPVRHHDDGSRPSMYDLAADLPDGRLAAIEVVAAADPVAVEHWNLMNGGGGRWIDDRLRGGWFVSVRAGSSWKRLRAALPELLVRAEQVNLIEIGGGHGRSPSAIDGEAGAIGVAHASQGTTSFPGSIYLTLDAKASFAGGGEPLEAWVSGYLRAPGTEDVLAKLASSSGDQRHAFIFVPGFTTAPMQVQHLLMTNDPTLPIERPDLPDPLTHVWTVSSWTAGVGIRWSPDTGWQPFEKLTDESS